jgi:Radical SAM superfamily
MQAPAVFLLDAGLNLNIRAFRNLRQAAAETGFLKNTLFWAEIYPTAVRDEHLDFLREVGPAYLGVGLQSMDPEVLRLHQRPAESARFETAVWRLAAVTQIELQVIFGLPGDTPEGFRRTLDYALSLPAAVRAYHCLGLPDALMTRGLPEWDLVFDPRNLSMTSCLGWTAEDIAVMRAELSDRSRRAGGKAGNFWWSFPAQRPSGAPALPG